MKTMTRTTKPFSPKAVRTASVQDILGPLRRTTQPQRSEKEYPCVCYVCLAKLTPQRTDALKSLGTPTDSWMCVKCSSSVTSPRLGIYMGEVGTSELKIVDKIYDDSVRDVFMEGADDKEDKDKE